MPRPKLPENLIRTHKVTIILNDAELLEAQRRAQAEGRTVAAWLRHTALPPKPATPIEQRATQESATQADTEAEAKRLKHQREQANLDRLHERLEQERIERTRRRENSEPQSFLS